jgi:ribonuclease HII
MANSSSVTKDDLRIRIGVDEAGRGCMWGSVFAGAVVLPADLEDDETMTPEERFLLRDSKVLSAKRREDSLALIKTRAIGWGIGESTSEEIDRFNILRATHTAMHRAIDMCIRSCRQNYPTMNVIVEHIFVDGDRFRTYIDSDENVIPHTCVVGGDASMRCIAAASNIAKTGRDHHVMTEVEKDPTLASKWKMEKHKGYCTSLHNECLRLYGAHPLHRRSYEPVKRIIESQSQGQSQSYNHNEARSHSDSEYIS